MLLDIVAPWILESWQDALRALSFDIPVVALDPYHGVLAIAAVALVCMLLAAHSVGRLPAGARIPARGLIGLVLLVPVAVAGGDHLQRVGFMPPREVAGPAGRVAAKDSAAALESPSPAAVAQSSVALEAVPPAPLPVPPPAPEASPPPPVAAGPVEAAAVEQPVKPAAAPPAVVSAAAAVRRVAQGLSRLMPRGTEARPLPGALVAVFFGTDRVVDPQSGRRDYTAERAGRLELGRAMVTIPRLAHGDASSVPANLVQAKHTADADAGAGAETEREFVVHEIGALDPAVFMQAVQARLAASARFKDHALVLIPGFNTSFDAALYRTAQLANDLDFDGAAYVYSWPSAGRIARYGYDRESARQAEPFLAEFLKAVVRESGAKSISVIAHGLGAGLGLDVLISLKDQMPPGVLLDQVILAAPDLERGRFEQQVRALAGSVKGITLYASASDRSLNISRRFAGAVPRAGDVPDGGPLVIAGVATVDVGRTGTEWVGLNHPSFVPQPAVIADIAARLRKVAPGAALESVPTPRGPYWRFPSAAGRP
jgi:esterase/lipase superfamily enzyme